MKIRFIENLWRSPINCIEIGTTAYLVEDKQGFEIYSLNKDGSEIYNINSRVLGRWGYCCKEEIYQYFEVLK